MRVAVAAAALALLLVAGCGSSGSGSAVERDLRRGEAQIRHTRDAKKLRSMISGALRALVGR